jgi:hypothetical protein
MNVHVKAPAAEVVFVVQVWGVGVAPPKVIVPIVVRTENPVPVTVTLVPTTPELGVRVILGLVTVNVAVAVSEGTVPISLPETVTTWPANVSVGTVNVHVKVPVAEVVWAVQVWVAIVPPAMVIVPIFVLMEYPVPATVTMVPIGPWVGVRVNDGLNVNVADAVSLGTVPTSLPETTTV